MAKYNYRAGYAARIYSSGAYSKLFETDDSHMSGYTISSGKVKNKLDGPSSATFTLPRTNPNADTISVGDRIYIERGEYTPIMLRKEDGEIFGGYVIDVERDIYGNAEVTASNYINCLNYWLHYSNTAKSLKTLSSASSFVFSTLISSATSPCGYSMSVTDISCNIDFPVNEYTQLMDIWNDCVEAANKVSNEGEYHYWYSYYHIAGATVSTTDKVVMLCRPENKMDTSGQTVELGKNITSITMEDEIPDSTIVLVKGQDADGNDLYFDGYKAKNMLAAETIDSLPWIEESVDFGDGFTADTLKSTAQNYINRKGAVLTSYQVNAIDLYGTDSTISPFKIGQRVHVVSSKHGLDVVLPITEIEIDLVNPLNTKISVGGTRPRITTR